MKNINGFPYLQKRLPPVWLSCNQLLKNYHRLSAIIYLQWIYTLYKVSNGNHCKSMRDTFHPPFKLIPEQDTRFRWYTSSFCLIKTFAVQFFSFILVEGLSLFGVIPTLANPWWIPVLIKKNKDQIGLHNQAVQFFMQLNLKSLLKF